MTKAVFHIPDDPDTIPVNETTNHFLVKNMPNLCPLCEAGNLHSSVVEEVIRYAGHDLHVAGIEISTCDTCAEQIVTSEQARSNERRFCDAKRRHDA